jgi:hypothetical protein
VADAALLVAMGGLVVWLGCLLWVGRGALYRPGTRERAERWARSEVRR